MDSNADISVKFPLKFAFVKIFVTVLETIGENIFIRDVICVRMKKGETMIRIFEKT